MNPLQQLLNDKTTNIFLDSGDPAETAQSIELLGFLDGQTTNPSLIAKSPQVQEFLKTQKFTRDELFEKYHDIALQIREVIPTGKISAEVYADANSTTDELLDQAYKIANWFPGIFVKLPITTAGLAAAEQLVAGGISVNMTLCFSQDQAAAVHAATKNFQGNAKVYVSPFIGRLDDIDQNGADLIKNIQNMYNQWNSHVGVLGASIRTVEHINVCIEQEISAITIPFKLIKEIYDVTVIDTVSKTVVATIPVGSAPGRSVAVGTKLYVNNTSSGNVSVIDTTTDTVIATITAGDYPNLAAAYGTNLYITNYSSNNVTVINTDNDTLYSCITQTCNYTAGAGGSISGLTTQTVLYGQNATSVTAIPNSGYTFTRWSDNSTDNPRTDTNITTDITVSAVFTAILSSGGCGGGGMPAGWSNLPITPTGGFKVSINSGASTTTNRIVNLSFNAGSDVKKMAISLTGDFNDASQENYSPTKQIDICSKFGVIKNPTCPDGTYKVYVKFYTYYGQSSGIASSTIILKSGSTPTENLQPTNNLPFTNPFTKYLQYRQTNADIKRLQIFLNSDPDTKVADSGAGSPGKETNYFGILTYKAVIKFQEKYAKDILDPWGFKKGTGYVGKTTLAKINELMKNK